ncbi:hypothetical protein GCM10009809_07500 [Isoptericola hypogeus]|uniref:Uncharacterized protein n=1 Tax=Isoptericola hypogeus TaxID=300179 RepID=A0ABN2IXJ5_9MICO
MTAPDDEPAAHGSTPEGPSTADPGPARRGVLEGLGVAVVAGIGGFAWFSAAGPPSEAERERLEDEQDQQQDQQEDELDEEQDQQDDELDEEQDQQDDEQDEREDEQDEDRSGPDRGRG